MTRTAKTPASSKADSVASSHITPADGNVFADLGFAPTEAEQLLAAANARIAKLEKLKKQAATALAYWVLKNGMTQLQAAQVLGVSRPRVSDLMNMKLTKFSLDMLVGMLFTAGLEVELVVP